MGGIADAQQARPIPSQQSVDTDRQELYIIPAAQLVHPGGSVRREFYNLVAKNCEVLLAHLLEESFGNDEAALPIVAAIERDKNPSRIEASHGRGRVVRTSTEAKPKNIHRSAKFLHFQTSVCSHDRAAAVCTHDKISKYFDHSGGSIGVKADHARRFFDKAACLSFHHETKSRAPGRILGKEVKKIPLRHQRDKAAMGRQVLKVCDGQLQLAELSIELTNLLMRQLEKFFEQSQLAHHLERRGVDRIATKITQEIAVLFQHQNFDARARQEIAQHHTGRAAAGDAAAHGYFLHHHDIR